MTAHSLKAMRQEFKDRGQFYTPPELATFIRSLVPGEPHRVYDPTCGRGSLLSAFADSVEKYGQDIDALAVSDAEIIPGFHGAVGDVLSNPAWLDERFDAIVANPPFSVRWEPQSDERFMSVPTVPTGSRADYAFLIHILHMLAPDGVAVVLCFPGILYRGGREGILRQWFVEQNVIDQVILIPGNTFTDTSISTACLVLRKDRDTDTIRFVDREHEIERDVAIAEVSAHGYALSVSTYIQPPPKNAEPFDPLEVEMAARRGFLRKLRAELKMSRMVAHMEGFDFGRFVAEVRAVVDDSESAENDPTELLGAYR